MTRIPTVLPALLLLYVKALSNPKTVFKCHTLIYFSSAWHMGVFGSMPVSENFVRYESYPGLPSISEYLNIYPQVLLDFPEENRRRVMEVVRRELTEPQVLILSDVIFEYGEKSDEELVALLSADPVWQEVAGPGAIIPPSSILRGYGCII